VSRKLTDGKAPAHSLLSGVVGQLHVEEARVGHGQLAVVLAPVYGKHTARPILQCGRANKHRVQARKAVSSEHGTCGGAYLLDSLC
jgi:hypothetical protein